MEVGGDGEGKAAEWTRVYGRQLVLDQLGFEGQQKLDGASVLVVGAGGLGSPIALYLAAAGVGKLFIVDGDKVEISNLHRQVIHTRGRVGCKKVESAKRAIEELNPDIAVEAIPQFLDAELADRLGKGCDVLVDASDNVETRLLLNDAAVLHGKPFVAGSAVRWEGQLSVYNMPPGSGCYRCVFPSESVPLKTSSSTSSNDAAPRASCASGGACDKYGVLGAVPGVIGLLQALEVIKILLKLDAEKIDLDACGESLQNLRGINELSSMTNALLVFDGKASDRMFRSFQLKGRSTNCPTCGDSKEIRNLELCDYSRKFPCDSGPVMTPEERLNAETFQSVYRRLGAARHAAQILFFDVRPKNHFAIGHLPLSISWPLEVLRRCAEVGSSEKRKKLIPDAVAAALELVGNSGVLWVVCICRRGNDSRHALRLYQQLARDEPELFGVPQRILNLDGGLLGLKQAVDDRAPEFQFPVV